MLLQREEERCLRRTGIGWLDSSGGAADVRFSSATVKRRRRTSASRYEFGDLGRIFTPGDTFVFPSLPQGEKHKREIPKLNG